MPETVELTDIVLRVIGAFYAFAGYVATRSAMMSLFLDRAIAAISLQKPKPMETAQNTWLLAASALVLIGGHPVVMAAQAAIHANLREHYGKWCPTGWPVDGTYCQESLLKLAWMAACAAMTVRGPMLPRLLTGGRSGRPLTFFMWPAI